MKFIKNDDESSLSHTKWNCQYMKFNKYIIDLSAPL